ncbi:hypothetical protein [Nonomuraea typhae]|nr:hypothetical protein [Nonomuraea typhae]
MLAYSLGLAQRFGITYLDAWDLPVDVFCEFTAVIDRMNKAEEQRG